MAGDEHLRRAHRLSAEVLEASGNLRRTLEAFEEGIQSWLDDQSGMSLAEYRSRGFPERRNDAYVAIRRFESAFLRLRANGVKHLVDGGMPIAEVARLMGRSRTFVTRLYRMPLDDG